MRSEHFIHSDDYHCILKAHSHHIQMIQWAEFQSEQDRN